MRWSMPTTTSFAAALGAPSGHRRPDAKRPLPSHAIHRAATWAATASPAPVATARWRSGCRARPANASIGRVPASGRPARCRAPACHRISSAPAPSDARGPLLEGHLAQRRNPRPEARSYPFRSVRRQMNGAGRGVQSTAGPVPAPAHRTSRQAWPRDAHGRGRAWPERAGTRSIDETSPETRRPGSARDSRHARHRWSLGSNHPRVHPGQKRADDTAASGIAIKTAFCGAGSCARLAATRRSGRDASPAGTSWHSSRYSRRRPRLARNA
jgi:hypothetical protein